MLTLWLNKGMKESTKYRILETIPGFLVWATFAGVIILSFVKPLWAIYFIIAFDIYWLLRIAYMLIYLLTSWYRYRRDLKIDWHDKLQSLNKDWRGYHHLVFLPTYKEPLAIVERPFAALPIPNLSPSNSLSYWRGKNAIAKIFWPLPNRSGQSMLINFLSLW